MEINYKPIDLMIMNNAKVDVRKNGFICSLFGYKTSLRYKPSASIITKTTRTFPKRCLEKVCWLVTQGELVRCETMTFDPNGNVMLTCYSSKDNRFLLMQASQYLNFEYKPVTKATLYVESEAEVVINNMHKVGFL